MRGERGQTTIAALFLTLLLVALLGGMVDLARLQSLRQWAYRVAEASALIGVAEARDYAAYVGTGELRLDAGLALTAAEQALLQGLAEKGLTGRASYDIRVHPTLEPGSYPDYPPVPHAGMLPGDWTPVAPAVGVYVELWAEPIFYGWINGNAPIPLRVFAAASMVTVE